LITPEEILSIYGVDVTKLSAPYSSYYIATSDDLWLNTVTPKLDSILNTPKTKIGDLIIITPDNYRSRIYANKLPSRHVNLTGPDTYYYIYPKAYLIGSLKYCITKYLDDWTNLNTQGSLTFTFDYDHSTMQVYVSGPVPVIAVRKVNYRYEITTLDSVFMKWGSKQMVQNFMDTTTIPGFTSCCFVGD